MSEHVSLLGRNHDICVWIATWKGAVCGYTNLNQWGVSLSFQSLQTVLLFSGSSEYSISVLNRAHTVLHYIVTSPGTASHQHVSQPESSSREDLLRNLEIWYGTGKIFMQATDRKLYQLKSNFPHWNVKSFRSSGMRIDVLCRIEWRSIVPGFAALLSLGHWKGSDWVWYWVRTDTNAWQASKTWLGCPGRHFAK